MDDENKENETDRPMITYREPIMTPEGVQDYKLHVVPVDEWAEYEREHGL